MTLAPEMLDPHSQWLRHVSDMERTPVTAQQIRNARCAYSINTVARRGYAAQCPNVGRLFKRLEFNVDLENQIISDVLEQKIDAKAVALHQLKANPKMLDAWLAGVKTRYLQSGRCLGKTDGGRNAVQ